MERQTHSRNNSYASTSRSGSCAFSTVSTRVSMDVIEGTTQRFALPRKNEEITAHVQRERWDAFFEPQYSFNAFIHDSNEPIDSHQAHRKNLDRLIDDGNNNIKSPYLRASTDARPSPKIPELSSNSPAAVRSPQTQARIMDRLALLQQIRSAPNDASGQPNGKIARFKQHFSAKARRLKREVQGDTISPDSTPSLDLEKTETIEKQRYYSRSFLCFMLGFLFPPFWLLGAFYISSYANKQTSACRRIDHIWRRRSRIAFGIFIIALMIVLVVVFVVKPGSIGWRTSRIPATTSN